MRNKLKEIEGERGTFTGVFARFGTKMGFKGTVETILIRNVSSLNGQFITDHLWLNLTKAFEELNLKPGDRIQFDARVKNYTRGYKGKYSSILNSALKKEDRTDYKLSHPTKITKI